MSNAIVIQQPTTLIEFDDTQLDLIKRTIAKEATDDELDLFMYQCKRTGLDPLAKQIHFQKFVSNNGKANVSFITTIDGYRLIADRTNRYAGSKEPVFEGRVSITDGRQYDHDSAPAKATVTVLKIVAGMICEFSSSVYWTEYYPSGPRGHMWRKMPHVMLAKVAEASALRKAFPQDLSNLYTSEEMEQASPAPAAPQRRLKNIPPVIQPNELRTEYLDDYEQHITIAAAPAAPAAPPAPAQHWTETPPASPAAARDTIMANVPRYSDNSHAAVNVVKKFLDGRNYADLTKSERITLMQDVEKHATERNEQDAAEPESLSVPMITS